MKLKNFAMKHIFLFSILVIFCSAAFLLTSSIFFPDEDWKSLILVNPIGRILPSILLFLLLHCFQLTKDAHFTKVNFCKGVLTFWPMYLTLIIFQCITWLHDPTMDITPQAMDLIAIIFYMLCVGMFEEMIFRGVIFNVMKCKWASSPNGIVKAAFASSCMFGLLHLGNLFDTPELIISTIAQVFYAVLYGLFFCGVYVKTKNLWSIIIAHAIIDLIGRLPSYFSSYMAKMLTSDGTVLVNIISWAMIIPFALLGLHYLRKAQNNQ